MRPAWMSRPAGDGAVQCLACAHQCTVAEGRCGICGVRCNAQGELQSTVYGYPVSLGMDPVEKKPLYHFLPGSLAFSLGTFGCNFRCSFCQNFEISQIRDRSHEHQEKGSFLAAESIVRLAVENGARSVACTYNEPTVWAEYALDIASHAREAGLKTIFVSNGFYSREFLDAALPIVDAYNIDLKSFSDDFYRHICGGRLQPVLEAIQTIHAAGAWQEITSLIIPGVNDGEEELHAMAHFVASVDPTVPWHVSRFFPMYRMADVPMTPATTIERAVRIGHEEGLLYVYPGNLVSPRTSDDTVCPTCRTTVIKRHGYDVCAPTGLRCPSCGRRLEGVEQ